MARARDCRPSEGKPRASRTRIVSGPGSPIPSRQKPGRRIAESHPESRPDIDRQGREGHPASARRSDTGGPSARSGSGWPADARDRIWPFAPGPPESAAPPHIPTWPSLEGWPPTPPQPADPPGPVAQGDRCSDRRPHLRHPNDLPLRVISSRTPAATRRSWRSRIASLMNRPPTRPW